MADWRDLLGPDSPLAEALPGFRPRREQRAMAEAVATALEERSTLVVEAGTGTGKTFAYLLPALYAGTRVIVSTGTRNLQDQLYHRDLPLVSRVVGRPVTIALLKGRSNYLCRHRLALELAAPAVPAVSRERRRLLGRLALWAESTSSGDIAEVESIADNDPIWPAVTSTRENCLGQDCPEFRQCHVVRARREAQAADLVVVNHHLLLADMALREEGFGELLPGAEAVILDEAHQFPEVAAQFFGLRFGSRGVTSFVRDTRLELERAGLYDTSARGLLETIEQAVGALLRVLAGLGERVEWAALPDAALEAAEDLAGALETIAQRLDSTENEVAELRHAGRRATEMVTRLRAILTVDEAEGLRWAECSARGVTLEFTPFEVADKLKAHVQQRPCAWVHTSATLAVGEDFAHYTRRVGAEDARTLLIASPFDFESKALLYLPPEMPEPSDRGHTAAVVDAALPLLRAAGGRAFLLFTSHRALTEAATRLRDAMQLGDRFPLLVQGDMPRDALLRRFREIGHAVLLGTSSFWEGVDVRGPALSVVVIDKLPFVAPDDPMLKARLEGLKRAGRNGFSEHQIPTAVLALKQGVGRLIRDPEDFGVVMIADPRLRTRGYGRTFVASLPPMRIVTDVREAAHFLRRHLGALADWGDP
jgi:ATP-dependent DNA helicase DinG